MSGQPPNQKPAPIPGHAVSCVRCMADLAGVPPGSACPVCGLAVEQSVELAVSDEQVGERGGNVAAGIVARDMPCVGCGYSIRGLPESGACPECGAPLTLSLRGRLLRFASPRYLSALHRGAALVEGAIAASIVALALSAVWQAFLPSFVSASGVAKAASFRLVFDGLSTAISVAGLIGWWMLSSPDPGEAEGAPGARARVLLRWGAAVQMAAAIVSLTLASIIAVAPASLLLDVARNLVDTAEALAGVVGFFAGVTVIKWLALRIPDARLAARAAGLRSYASALLLALVVIGVASVLLVVVLSASGSAVVAGAGALLGLAACVGIPVLGIAAFVAFIMYVLLIDRLRRALGAERRSAEAFAAAHAAG